MIKFSITLKSEDKSLTRTFKTDAPVLLSEDDSHIKEGLEATLKDFHEVPEKITVKATLEL